MYVSLQISSVNISVWTFVCFFLHPVWKPSSKANFWKKKIIKKQGFEPSNWASQGENGVVANTENTLQLVSWLFNTGDILRKWSKKTESQNENDRKSRGPKIEPTREFDRSRKASYSFMRKIFRATAARKAIKDDPKEVHEIFCIFLCLFHWLFQSCSQAFQSLSCYKKLQRDNKWNLQRCYQQECRDFS